MKKFYIAFTGICMFFFFIPYPSFGKEISAERIATLVHDRYVGNNSRAIIIMVLKGKTGNKRTRKFVSLFLEKNSLRFNLIRFLSPKEIEGTGFLSIEKKDGTTIQYLYLPVLRRARRIVSSRKDRPFVNSDFTYEDMERRPVKDFYYKLCGEEQVGKYNCYILQTRPREGIRSQYSRTISFIAKDLYIPLRVKFYNKKGEFFKKYEVISMKKIQNIWTPWVVRMENIQTFHSTTLRVETIKYNIKGIVPALFTRQNLESW